MKSSCLDNGTQKNGMINTLHFQYFCQRMFGEHSGVKNSKFMSFVVTHGGHLGITIICIISLNVDYSNHIQLDTS